MKNRKEIIEKVNTLQSTVDDICEAIYVRSDSYIRCKGLIDIDNQILNMPRTLLEWRDLGYGGEPQVISIGYNSAFDYVQQQGETPITSMRNYFANDTTLLFGPYVGDTSNVSDWYGCYSACGSLLEISDKYDYSKASNCQNLFSACKNLRRLPKLNFTNKLTNLQGAFNGCTQLLEIDVSDWDMINVKTLHQCFNNCSKLGYLDLSKWDIDNVTSTYYCFNGCSTLKSIGDTSNWNTTSIDNASAMFYDCNLLQELDVSNWNMSSATRLDGMFANCSTLKELNFTNWDTYNNTTFGNFLYGCKANIIGFDNLKVTNKCVALSNMNYQATGIKGNLDLRHWDLSNATSIAGLFRGCSGITGINVDGWNLDKATSIGYMFANCQFAQMDFRNVTFNNNITDIQQIFTGCRAMTKVYLGNLDTSKVGTSSGSFLYTFQQCNVLQEIDGILDMSGATANYIYSSTNNKTYNMFNGCNALTTVKIKNLSCSINLQWCPLNYESLEYMITNANNAPATNTQIRLSATSYGFIDDTLRNIATNKGYTIIR